MPELIDFLGEQIAARLREYQSNATPKAKEEVQDAIRAAGKIASLTLYAWDAVQQSIAQGAEGGRARELVEKAFPVLAMWLTNIRIAIRIAEQWPQKAPFSMDELRTLETSLQQAHSSAEHLLAFVNVPPPALSKDTLAMIEAVGQGKDTTEYLEAEAFLARTRARMGS
jgi:hypothetical protein